MSIASTMNNALTGLSAAARAAEVVSSNTANVMTEGYARRELSIASQVLGNQGGGVNVVGVNRVVNQVVINDRRLADAALDNADTRVDYYTHIEKLLGEPGSGSSLSDSISDLESAFVEAASRPDSEGRLDTVLRSAQALTSQLNSASDEIQDIRMSADRQIAEQVDLLNTSLQQIDELNTDIVAARSSGQDASALFDKRQALVDQISTIVPVREVARDNDQISLFTTGGAILLEGTPVTFEFTAAGAIDASKSLGAGTLSGLTMNGMTVSTKDDGLMGGGSLGALFSIRDELAPAAQTQIDAFARDLISRFEDPTVDTTLTPGDPGLFTDAGNALDTTLEVGLAGRISVNALVDPTQGGATWRLRDGLGAATQGSVGDATLLNAMTVVMSDPRVPASGNFIGSARSVSGLASDILSQVSASRLTAETTQSYTSARQDALKSLELADGVDTDQEMQSLMLIEQAYAANAQVIRTMDELIQTLLAI